MAQDGYAGLSFPQKKFIENVRAHGGKFTLMEHLALYGHTTQQAAGFWRTADSLVRRGVIRKAKGVDCFEEVRS